MSSCKFALLRNIFCFWKFSFCRSIFFNKKKKKRFIQFFIFESFGFSFLLALFFLYGIQGSFIELDNPYVELDAVKRSEDKEYLVVRFHEYTGSKRKVGVKLNFEYKGWMESDLRERPIEEMHTEKEIQLEVKPFEIKTILLKLA